MAWRIDVAPAVRPALAVMDPSLRQEMLERTALIADDPMAHLRRPIGEEEFGDVLVYEYASEVIGGLRVMMYFGEVDVSAKRLVLIAVTDRMGDNADED